jgi:hypothetical protein
MRTSEAIYEFKVVDGTRTTVALLIAYVPPKLLYVPRVFMCAEDIRALKKNIPVCVCDHLRRAFNEFSRFSLPIAVRPY